MESKNSSKLKYGKIMDNLSVFSNCPEFRNTFFDIYRNCHYTLTGRFEKTPALQHGE